jgi:2-polyprenyl-3-methyl-5-hydroxy-6-metoxy-1,4-benzoquinol methylase
MPPLHNFPSWEEIYKSQPVEDMPWFCRELDFDLVAELARRKLTGGTFLDIGTGPGTQAIALAHLGFTVTGTDLSPAAIQRAQELQTPVTFVTDDVVHTQLRGPFNFIFDRGCFHVLDPEDRASYVRTVKSLLAPGGILFLKCFSLLETNIVDGPYRFTPDELRAIFEPHFNIESMIESEFQGTLNPNPKALFAVMKND